MIEPPRQIVVGRILEIDDGVLVAVEQIVFEQLRCLVRHPRKDEFRPRMKLVFKESAEQSRRRGPVKAVVVVKNANSHEAQNSRRENLTSSPKPAALRNSGIMTKQ
jgi:hypothetical protein